MYPAERRNHAAQSGRKGGATFGSFERFTRTGSCVHMAYVWSVLAEFGVIDLFEVGGAFLVTPAAWLFWVAS